LADSIRQYGLLQPVTVTRIEKKKEDGGLGYVCKKCFERKRFY